MKNIIIVLSILLTTIIYADTNYIIKEQVIDLSNNVKLENSMKVLLNEEINTSSFSNKKKIKKDTILLPIIYTSNLSGTYLDNYIKVLSKIEDYKMNTNIEPLIINNGSIFWESKYINFLSTQPNGINFILNLLKNINFDVINIGRKDFYTPFNIINKISKNKKISNFPIIATNINCLNSQNSFCSILNKKKIIVTRNGIKIAIISVVTKDIMTKSSKQNIEGLDVLSEIENTNKFANSIKKNKEADIVILLSQIESSKTSPQKILELSKKLKDIDLIISNSKNIKIISKYKNNIPILGSNFDNKVSLVTLEIKNNKNKYVINNIKFNKIDSIKSKNIKNEKEIKEKTTFFKRKYSEKYNKRVNKMNLNMLQYNTFVQYLLKLMVEKTNTDIAIINKKALNKLAFPTDTLTYRIIDLIINYNEKMVSFKMKGKLLKEFISINKDKLLFTNVDLKSLKINGTNIINDKVYKVSTIKYLADGGDSRFTNKFIVKNKKEYSRIKDMLITHLKKDKFQIDDSKLDINEFEDLSNRFLWEFYNNLGLFYIKNGLKNSSSYEKSKLSSVPLEAFRVNLLVKLLGTSKYHILENSFLLDYNQNRVDKGVLEESKDIITYKLNYKNNYFKTTSDFFITPLPYAEFKLDSELTKAKDVDNHYYQIYFSGGASFLTLKNKLEIKLGALTSKDFSNSNNKFETGMILAYYLSNYDIGFLDIPIKISSKLEYFKSFSNNLTNNVDFSFENNIPIFGYFHFTFKVDAYLYSEKKKDIAYSYNMLFGINMIYNDWF